MRKIGRSAVGFVGEVGFFYAAMVFASTTTVLPGFVSQLTSSLLLVGLVLTLAEGAWRLPQLAVAFWLSPKRRKKHYLTRAALVSRPAYLIMAIALWAGIARHPVAGLSLFFTLHFVVYAALSIDSLVWWDVFAKAVPVGRRGRILGASTALHGLLSIAAGTAVAFSLSERGPAFPANYAWLMALSTVCLLVSLASWLLVREPIEELVPPRIPWKAFWKHAMASVRSDRTFRRFLAVRLIAGFEGLSLGFYVLFAARVLSLPGEYIGIYAGTQTAGSIVGGVLFGFLSERLGNTRVVRIATLLGASAPLVGWLFASQTVTASWRVLYGWIFFAAGLFAAALFVVFNSLVVELAPRGKRVTYIGVFNLASGLVVLWPALGGWMLERTSFGTLFGVTTVLMSVAHAITWRLRARGEIRRVAQES